MSFNKKHRKPRYVLADHPAVWHNCTPQDVSAEDLEKINELIARTQQAIEESPFKDILLVYCLGFNTHESQQRQYSGVSVQTRPTCWHLDGIDAISWRWVNRYGLYKRILQRIRKMSKTFRMIPLPEETACPTTTVPQN